MRNAWTVANECSEASVQLSVSSVQRRGAGGGANRNSDLPQRYWRTATRVTEGAAPGRIGSSKSEFQQPLQPVSTPVSTCFNRFNPLSTRFNHLFLKNMRRESGLLARRGEKLEPTYVGGYKLRSLALVGWGWPRCAFGQAHHGAATINSHRFPSIPSFFDFFYFNFEHAGYLRAAVMERKQGDRLPPDFIRALARYPDAPSDRGAMGKLEISDLRKGQ